MPLTLSAMPAAQARISGLFDKRRNTATRPAGSSPASARISTESTLTVGTSTAKATAASVTPSGPKSEPMAASATKPFQRAAPWKTDENCGPVSGSACFISIRIATIEKSPAPSAEAMGPMSWSVRLAVASVCSSRAGKKM